MSDQEQKTNSSENPTTTEESEPVRPPTRRSAMPQDVRYSTEPSDQAKLMDKFTNYQISDTNACNIRFLADNRQKKTLLGRNEDNTNLHSLSKTFRTNIFPGYQLPGKHSYKIFGAEANVRRCLIEIMTRMFKQTTKTENVSENKSPSTNPTAIFVTTINPDSSITEVKKDTQSNTNEEQVKYTPVEQKSTFTLIMLITSQGQEVLKKNWSFFGGLLQQRLNVVVTNPVKLPKFGDKQVQHELTITGELIENLADTSLQIAAFINDVLGVAVQPYKYDEPSTSNETKRTKNENQSSSSSQQQGRTFVNRNRSGIFEQTILIRNRFVSRIIGTRGSNLKRIQTKCHLRDMIISRQANENGYVECTLASYQARNLSFAIDTIRSFLRNEDESAVIVPESSSTDTQVQDSPHVQELAPPEQSSKGTLELPLTGFLTKNLDSYPQPSYNFQNVPSFDFTHQATSASRKTDKRRGDLTDLNKTPTDPANSTIDKFSPTNYLSNSPKHKSKRSCPETKEIDCTTDEGFWIQKQFYNALDDSSKQLFDSLIEKLDKIRIANEENAARKQQRLVGRNRANKSRAYAPSISYLTEDNNRSNEKETTTSSTQDEVITKLEPLSDTSDEKENKQDLSVPVNNEN